MSKLAVIIGVTGNQGGSVAQRFLQDSQYRVRGITRDPASAKAQELSSQGIEIVKADLEDVDSLIAAFRGANVIFSVTNYWEPFFRPDHRQAAADAGTSIRRHAYEVEYRQGKNIADAAAAVADSLDDNGFLASTLSHGKKCSNGVYEELYHFDAKADIFPYYVQEKWPQLAAKTSYIQTGFFTSSYKFVPTAYFQKVFLLSL
jgi:NmrA-like family